MSFSDTSSDDEPPEKKAKNDDANEKSPCKVCFFHFDDERPEAALTSCGHKACVPCLDALQPKTCPICRAEFTEEQILKLFD